MKVILSFVLVTLILISGTSTAFGWKAINQLTDGQSCKVNCDFDTVGVSSAEPMNFILLGMASLFGIGIYLRITRLRKYETFSLKCRHCGRRTNGLKCVICEARKPRVR